MFIINRLLNQMAASYGSTPEQAVSESPRATLLAPPWVTRICSAQNDPAKNQFISPLENRNAATGAINAEAGKMRPLRFLPHKRRRKSADIRLRNSVLFYRPTAARLGARWCGPAWVVTMESDAWVVTMIRRR